MHTYSFSIQCWKKNRFDVKKTQTPRNIEMLHGHGAKFQ